MANKQFNARQTQKHDTEANWNLTDGFIPFDGELIVYDKDATHDKPRIKIGDGVTDVKNLPFSGGGYDKPAEGIPYSDLDSELQADINRARNNPMVISLTLDAEYDGEGKKYTYTENYFDIVNNRDHIIFKIGTTLIKPSTAILDEVLVFSGLVTKDAKYQMVVITVPNTAEKYVLVYDDETILTNKTFEIIEYDNNDEGEGNVWKCDHTFEELRNLLSRGIICIVQGSEIDLGNFTGLLRKETIVVGSQFSGRIISDNYFTNEGWPLGVPVRGVLTHTESSITFEVYGNIDIDVIYSRTDGGQISCNVPYSRIISMLEGSTSVSLDLFKQTNYSKYHINGIFIDIVSSNNTTNIIQLGSPHLGDNGTILYTQFIYRGEDVGGNQVIALYHASDNSIEYQDDIRLANIHHIDSIISGSPGRVLMHNTDMSDSDPTWEMITATIDFSSNSLGQVLNVYILNAVQASNRAPESLVRLTTPIPVSSDVLSMLYSIIMNIMISGRPVAFTTIDIKDIATTQFGVHCSFDNVSHAFDEGVVISGAFDCSSGAIVNGTVSIQWVNPRDDNQQVYLNITSIAHQTKQIASPTDKPLVMPMVPAPVTGTLQLPVASWQNNNDGTYYQNITLTGSTQYSKIDLQPDATVLAQLSSDGVGALYVQNLNNTLKAVAVGNMPSVDLSVMYVMSAVYDGAVTPGGAEIFTATFTGTPDPEAPTDFSRIAWVCDKTYSEIEGAFENGKMMRGKGTVIGIGVDVYMTTYAVSQNNVSFTGVGILNSMVVYLQAGVRSDDTVFGSVIPIHDLD